MRPPTRLRVIAGGLAGLAVLALAASTALAGTLAEVRKRGALVCGVALDEPGFSMFDAKGAWSGLDVEFCGALAAAVLGRKDAVKLRPLTGADRLAALKAGEVDVLMRAGTWTMSRDTELGVRFTATMFHDGQGFMVRRAQGVASALELSGASICVVAGSPAEAGLASFFDSRRMRVKPVAAPNMVDVLRAYVAQRCEVLTGDVSTLARERARLPNPADHLILPELATTEPYAPAVRQGDEAWFSIVRWAVHALIAAEELGVTSANVDAMRASPLMSVRLLLGVDSAPGQSLGLATDWAFQMIRQIGNYGEIFERTLGQASSFKLERRHNGLWTRGGLMIAPPVR